MAIRLVEAKKLALWTTWPISDESAMRLSRRIIECIHSTRTRCSRALMVVAPNQRCAGP